MTWEGTWLWLAEMLNEQLIQECGEPTAIAMVKEYLRKRSDCDQNKHESPLNYRSSPTGF